MKRFVLIALVIALGMFGASFCMAENAGQDTTYAISINENEYGWASVCTNAESRSFSRSGGSASAGAKVWLKARLKDEIELEYGGKYTFKTWNVTYRETQDAAPKPVNVYYDYGFKNKNSEEIGAWCFIMPAGDVTVSPVFAEAAVLNVHGHYEVFVNGKSIDQEEGGSYKLPVGEEITLMIGTGSDLGSRISDVRVNGESLTNLKPWEMFATNIDKVKEFEGNGPYCQVSFIMPEGEADVEVTKTSVSADDYTPLLSEDEDGLGEDTQFKKHWCYSYTPKKSGYYTFTYAEYSILWVYDVSIGNTMGNGPYKMIAGHTYYLYALNDFENEADRICTMKVERTALLTPHTVTVDSNIQHGAIAASPIPFYEGEKVGLTITPDAGYILDTLTVSVGETPLETSWLSRTVYGFIAPLEDSFPEDDSSVRITATFKQIEPISYTGGSLGTNYLPVTTATKELRSGWYAVTEDVTMNERMIVTGDVNLLLCDGKTLNAACGIGVARGNSLTIWTQNGGTGALRAIAERSINHVGAGIGGYNDLTSGNTDTWYGGSTRSMAARSRRTRMGTASLGSAALRAPSRSTAAGSRQPATPASAVPRRTSQSQEEQSGLKATVPARASAAVLTPAPGRSGSPAAMSRRSVMATERGLAAAAGKDRAAASQSPAVRSRPPAAIVARGSAAATMAVAGSLPSPAARSTPAAALSARGSAAVMKAAARTTFPPGRRFPSAGQRRRTASAPQATMARYPCPDTLRTRMEGFIRQRMNTRIRPSSRGKS